MRGVPLLTAFAVVLLLLSAPAHASDDDDAAARALYEEGKQAFERNDFTTALDRFKRAYLTSQKPELLFNMSSAQQKLDRPHDAAESLRAYLRVKPEDPDRPQIEERIRALEEKQRLLDEERARAAPPPPATAPSAPPAAVVSSPATNALTAAPPRRSHRGLIVGLSVAGVIVVGAVVGIAVALSLPAPSPSTLGTHPGTH